MSTTRSLLSLFPVPLPLTFLPSVFPEGAEGGRGWERGLLAIRYNRTSLGTVPSVFFAVRQTSVAVAAGNGIDTLDDSLFRLYFNEPARHPNGNSVLSLPRTACLLTTPRRDRLLWNSSLTSSRRAAVRLTGIVLEFAASDCGLLIAVAVSRLANRVVRKEERKKRKYAELVAPRIDEPCNVRFHR